MIYRWIRDLHLYCGLFVSPFVLLFAGSVFYLKLAGIVLSGWQMARALLVAQRKRAEDPLFYGAKIATAHCFSEYVLTQARGLETAIVSARGDDPLFALSEAQF